jgi:hypothetical protein
VLCKELVAKRDKMMLDPEVLEARIALRVAELRTLAARTAVLLNRMLPHEILQDDTDQKQTGPGGGTRQK